MVVAPHRTAHHASWPFCRASRVALALLVIILALLSPDSSDALSFRGKPEVLKEVDHLVEQAMRGEDYHAALDKLVHYAETLDNKWGDQLYVFEKLEELAAPELKQYFLDLAQHEIEIKISRPFRGIAHRVYWATLLAEAESKAEEETLLLQGLNATIDIPKESRTGIKSTFVREWAADNLCSRGDLAHFDNIIASINSYKTGKTGQQLIDLCRRKMEVLNSFGSRIDAMEHVLVSGDPAEDDKIRGWALNELFQMRSHEADELMFEHVVRSLQDIEAGVSVSQLFAAVIYLHRREWTVEDYVDRGIDQTNANLSQALYLARGTN